MLEPPHYDKRECSGAPEAMSAHPTPLHRHQRQPELSDSELVAAIRRGDSNCAHALYDRLQPAIEHTIRRVLRQRTELCDDLVQITFERIIRAIGDNRFAGQSTLATWASAIAGHVAIDALRRAVRERRLFSEVPPAEVTPTAFTERGLAERRLEARSEIQRLHGVLGKMKPSLAETVVLYDVLGHSLEEVATLMGVTPSAAQSRLFRGRKELVRRAAIKRKGAE